MSSTQQHSVALVEIVPSERGPYLAALYGRFGRSILSDPADLDSLRQAEVEQARHIFNQARLASAVTLEPPRRLLISATQACNFVCPHCWVFSGPEAKAGLQLSDLRKIQHNCSQLSDLRWTISGGELFILPHFGEILAQLPVDCIYSNGFWGIADERRREYVDTFVTSIDENPCVERENVTLILSYDQHHVDGAAQGQHLGEAQAQIIAALYHNAPEIRIRISHAEANPEDRTYQDVLQALAASGFELTDTSCRDPNGNVVTATYEYRAGDGPTKSLAVDSFPVSLVSRALLNPPAAAIARTPRSLVRSLADRPRPRYEFTIGADGRVGLYDVLFAPPAPCVVGNLLTETWSEIARRLAVDPIALTLQRDGLQPFVDFTAQFAPQVLERIERDTQTVQQFLYLVLLNSIRRLHLNVWLANRLVAEGELGWRNPTDNADVLALLDNPTDEALRAFHARQP